MTAKELISLFDNDQRTEAIAKGLSKENSRVQLKGLCGSAEAFVANAVVSQMHGTHLFLLDDKEQAAYFLNDLENLLGKTNVLFFPSSYRYPYRLEKTDNANVLHRAEVLGTINKSKATTAIVSYAEALCEKVVTRSHLQKHTMKLKNGDTVSLDFMNEVLLEYGFHVVDFVTQPGEFAIRGGIVDIFSYDNDLPYRIEFFGDDIESIRTFDMSTQLSVKDMGKITIVPNVEGDMLREQRQTFLEFLPPQTVVWTRNTQIAADRIEKEFKKAQQAFEKLEGEVKHLPPEELYINPEVFTRQLLEFRLVQLGKPEVPPTAEVQFEQAPQPTFNKNFDLLIDNLQGNKKAGYTNLIVSGQAKQIERLYNIFEDLEALPPMGGDGGGLFTPISIALHQGFIDHSLKIACYTDHQIFERYHRFRLKEGFAKAQQDITIKEMMDLKKGDYVTHIDHGVGVFDGLEKIDVHGKHQEAIRLKYKEGDILYVSIHSLHRIAKFAGKDGGEPKVNKLGSKAWASLKQKTKKKVKEIAFDLIKLYAKRKATKGFEFSPDTYLQTELEASFIYEDTPDQLKATQAVKEDMQQPHPMDRLVCGDVGFGKTEVAIRAAFKAVADSKQVAILVPTTILALQHYKTFSERLEEFPCNIDYINRFKSAGKQRESLQKLKEGKIDIIIGTHRLLGKDVEFKDLGLLVVDEEQKFGVSAKDKLKTMRANVDTLTLTATPIPRTLQFSLMGARDLSIINTPPPNRYPVQTELQAMNENVIRDAIRYEIQRGGQVFFVHNRIQNIEEVAGMLQRLVPDARIAIGHGQMEGEKLESVMLDFIDGAYDVLLSTTIIESGLDIPNANTIIINQAQNFGLSDLHQMRGRVGRSNKKAFCYLLAPPLASLTTEARKRLNAITQFSDLGSGFNIAMRDLDIRGAGNLLGGEQSGFIGDIGFDMYHKILDEAVEELKQKEFAELFKEEQHKVFVKDCQIDTDLEIMLPTDYVNNIQERLSLYKELSSIEVEEALQAYEKNLDDRFGPLPEPANALMDTIRLRWIAKDIGFERLILKSGKMIGHFVANPDSPFYQSEQFTYILSYVQENPNTCTMREKDGKLRLSFGGVHTVKEAIARLHTLQPELQDH